MCNDIAANFDPWMVTLVVTFVLLGLPGELAYLVEVLLK